MGQRIPDQHVETSKSASDFAASESLQRFDMEPPDGPQCVGMIHTESTVIDCRILGISAAGARVRAGSKSAITGPLQLSVEEVGVVSGRAVWQDGEILSIEFRADSSRTTRFLRDYYRFAFQRDERRHHRRRAVLWQGHLFSGDQETDCTIWNISLGGVKIRLKRPVEMTGSVMLDISRYGAVACRLAWQRGREIGLSFIDDIEEVQEFLRRSQSVDSATEQAASMA